MQLGEVVRTWQGGKNPATQREELKGASASTCPDTETSPQHNTVSLSNLWERGASHCDQMGMTAFEGWVVG